MGRGQLFEERFRKVLKDILPASDNNLTIAVYSRADTGDEWKLEVGSEKQYVCAKFESSSSQGIPDSRIGEWGRDKYLLWKIYSGQKRKESLLLRNFLEKFTEKLAGGFIDCKMFEDIEDKIVIRHIFSNVEDPDYFLRSYVDHVLNRYELPGKSILTQLSAQMYEKRPIHGILIFMSEEEWGSLQNSAGPGRVLSLEHVSREQRELKMDNMRMLRKLLEMNTEDTCAVIVKGNEPAVVGITVRKAVEDQKSLATIIFWGYLKWGFGIGSDIGFVCDNGRYNLWLKDNLKTRCHDKLECLGLSNEKYIVKIIKKLAKERHGTSIVFMETGVLLDELKRLDDKNRYIRLGKTDQGAEKGIDLFRQLKKTKGITSIDGALIADLQGEVYAIGAILDGEAVCPGEVSRGARYNSVMNYLQVVKNKNQSACIFGAIISEDETVEIVIPEEKNDVLKITEEKSVLYNTGG